jgi:trimethylamine--corrinoid protein Co-methyltransferase
MLHLNILTAEMQEKVHNAALNVLKSVGCEINDKKWLDLLADAGVKVDYTSSRVFITDEDLIINSLSSCGRVIRKLSRNSKNDIILGKGFPKTHTPEGSTHIIDLKTQERHPAQLSDLSELTKVCDALPNVDLIICPIVPTDVPPALQSIIPMKSVLENSSKPAIPGGTGLNEALPYIIQMQEIIAGDRDITDYSLGFGSFVTSPLTFAADQLDIMWQCTERGIACSVGSAPQAASTAPASLAGMLTQFTAEILMGIVMCQVKKPGLNQYVYVRTYLINPRFGSINCSNPEVGLIQAAATQLFKEKYSLPVNAGWAVSDSHSICPQTTFEKGNIWLLSILAGADMISGVGGLSSGLTASVSQAIIDDEIISYLRHCYSGIIIDEFHLAIDMIQDVGIGGTFLAHPETGKILRNEQWFPNISNHETYEGWKQAGSLDIVAKADKKAIEILETHEVEPMEPSIQKKLKEIITEATRKLS